VAILECADGWLREGGPDCDRGGRRPVEGGTAGSAAVSDGRRDSGFGIRDSWSDGSTRPRHRAFCTRAGIDPLKKLHSPRATHQRNASNVVIPPTASSSQDGDAMMRRVRMTVATLKRRMDARLDTVQRQMDARFDAVHRQMDARFEAVQGQMDARFEAVQAQMDARFEAVQAQMDARFGRVDNRFDSLDQKLDAIVRMLSEKHVQHERVLDEHERRIRDLER
jgi:hypothetical protein